MRHDLRLHALLFLLALPLAAPAGAAATDLFLSELIEGSSNNKAVEIYNGTGAPVDLAAGGYTLQFYFNGGTTANFNLALSGTLADGEAFVIAPSNANATILAAADQVSGTSWFNGDDAVVLRKGGSTGDLLDVAGQIGVDPGTQWGAGLASTADNTIRRMASVCAGDANGSDAFDPAGEWDGFATDTFDGLGSHSASCGGGSLPTDPAASTGASPASLAAGDATLLTVAVVPGANPASTGLTVSADLGAVGGSATQAFFDDGSNGDAVAGDLTFSWQASVSAGTSAGPKSLAVAVADAEGRSAAASIALSVVARVDIADIQGQGVGSPLPVGTEVVTEGIVTARRANGYFIQSAIGEEDGDPATAEGLFVFTNVAPPAAATVGNRVRVAGRVTQFSRTPHGYPLTQLGSASATVLANGQALPPAVVIDESVLSPGVSTAALGRYQGMRVQLPAAKVVGATNAFGDFHVTLPQTARPAREPGIAVLDAVPLPAGNNIPVFDRNPERLRVESTGLEGGTALNVDAGTLIEGMQGVMYYDRGDFTLLIGDNSSLAVSGGAYVSAVPAAEEGAVRVGSYNIENLSGGESVPLNRLSKLSEVFCQYLRNPDVVGLVEIANLETAQRLARAINDNEFGTCPTSPMYQAYLLSTSGNQRLGYLVKTAPLADGRPRVEVSSVTEQFVADTLTAPDGTANGVLFDRAPLLLQGRVNGERGRSYSLNVLLNHTLSLLDVNDLTPRAVWGTDGDRSRGKRLQQAVKVSELVESIQSADATAPLVLIGDYNAFDFNDGYVDVLGIIQGTPAPSDQVLAFGESAVTRPLVNLIGTKPVSEQYSYVFEGNTQTLDHAIVNQAVIDSTEATLFHARVNSDFATDNAADPTVPVRTSDHDPLVADLVVPAFLDADLATTVFTPFKLVFDGQSVPFVATVRNRGESRALRPEITLRIDGTPSQVRQVLAAGWDCGTPVVVAGGSEIFCGRETPMAPGEIDFLLVTLEAVRLTPIDSIGLRAEADTRSNDTRPGNDAGADSAKVVGRPRWTWGD